MARHEEHLSGFGARLRPLDQDDAAAVLALRTSPQNSRYIGKSVASVSLQRDWIAAQISRPGDYYFAVVGGESGLMHGAIAVYEIDEEKSECEWGRWVIDQSSGAALASYLLALDFIFATKGLDRTYSRTLAENTQVVSFHDSTGAARSDFKESTVVDGRTVSFVRHELTAADWGTLRPRMARLAEGAARFVK